MADMYMRNIRDWREATIMLSFEEKGYYDELLNLIYIYDDCLADNDDLICRAMPINKKRHLRLKEKLLNARLISIKEGFYFNKRTTEEILKINELSQKNKLKAQRRWAKSLKTNENSSAAAEKQHKPQSDAADAKAMLNLNSESEGDLKTNIKSKEGSKNENQKENQKCTINEVLDPDGEIPENYREFAESQGLSNPQRAFENWANWWVSENGRKAGRRGWFATWKPRVRKDVERQMAQGKDQQRRNGNSTCATTEGARLALNRRRNRGRKI